MSRTPVILWNSCKFANKIVSVNFTLSFPTPSSPLDIRDFSSRWSKVKGQGLTVVNVSISTRLCYKMLMDAFRLPIVRRRKDYRSLYVSIACSGGLRMAEHVL